MFQNLLQHKYRLIVGIFSLVVLMLIRNYESTWFYDPFIRYFKSEFQGTLYPQYDSFDLLLNWLIRYGLNTIASLLILYVLFQEISIIKIAVILYVFFFVFLMFLIFLVLCFCDETYVMILFYIRRFLIQPLFLILFITAF